MSGAPSLVAPPLRRRMACWLYEALLLFALALIATLLFSVVVQMRHALESRWLLQVYLAMVGAAYCSWFWSKGQTLAMKTWRIAIVDRHGRRVTQGRALLRYVYCAIWVIPPLAAFVSRRFTLWEVGVVFAGWVLFYGLLSRFHPQRQFWHDAWAGTRLVDAA